MRFLLIYKWYDKTQRTKRSVSTKLNQLICFTLNSIGHLVFFVKKIIQCDLMSCPGESYGNCQGTRQRSKVLSGGAITGKLVPLLIAETITSCASLSFFV